MGEMEYQDGNALAGPFAEIFTIDMTVAQTTCAACSRNASVADLRVYGSAAGFVARCAGCDEVIARYVRTPRSAWLDLRGTVALELPLNVEIAGQSKSS